MSTGAYVYLTAVYQPSADPRRSLYRRVVRRAILRAAISAALVTIGLAAAIPAHAPNVGRSLHQGGAELSGVINRDSSVRNRFRTAALMSPRADISM
jgi:hypothetical protein